MSSPDQRQGFGATIYTVVSSFVGGAAGGAWLSLILMSLVGLYGHLALWEDFLAGTVAGTTVAVLSVLCGRVAGRLSGLRVVLIAAVAALNLAGAAPRSWKTCSPR